MSSLPAPLPSPLPIHLLLIFTGSVATVKIFPLISLLSSLHNVEIQVVISYSAEYFFSIEEFKFQFPLIPIFRDQDEWGKHKENQKKMGNINDHHSASVSSAPSPSSSQIAPESSSSSSPSHSPLVIPSNQYVRDSPILHIDLSKWADIILISPLSSHSLASIASGFSNTLMLSILKAWDFSLYTPSPTVLLCPAMNTKMWDHPLTQQHLQLLLSKSLFKNHYGIISPVSKKLACGDIGVGAMAEVGNIVEEVSRVVEERRKIKRGEKVEERKKNDGETTLKGDDVDLRSLSPLSSDDFSSQPSRHPHPIPLPLSLQSQVLSLLQEHNYHYSSFEEFLSINLSLLHPSPTLSTSSKEILKLQNPKN